MTVYSETGFVFATAHRARTLAAQKIINEILLRIGNSLREFETRPDHMEVLSHYCQTNYSLSKKERTLEDYMAEHLYWLYASGDLEYTS